MTKENENPETGPQDPAPSGLEPDRPEEVREPPPPLELDAPSPPAEPQPPRKLPAAKIVFIVLTLAVAALGGTVYLLLQERDKTLYEIRGKLARFDSQLQDIGKKQNTLAQSVQGLETVRQDLRAFKDETSAQIAALDQELRNALQQMAAVRPALPPGTAETAIGAFPESGTVSGETAGQPVEEKVQPRQREEEVKPAPAQPQPRPADKNEKIQQYLDFVEFTGRKTVELLQEGFNKAGDYIADLLK
ncbi:MAG: hypothetical protein HY580_01615 [Nitrospinae bacterium]|nr:hypothetical protein [Nitrospinota bacterium]